MSINVWTRAAAACGVASGTFTLGFYGTEKAFKEYERLFPDLDEDEEDDVPQMKRFGPVGTVGPAQPLEKSGTNSAKGLLGGSRKLQEDPSLPGPCLKPFPSSTNIPGSAHAN